MFLRLMWRENTLDVQGESRDISTHELTANDGRNQDAQRGTKTRQRMVKATIFKLENEEKGEADDAEQGENQKIMLRRWN